MNDSSYTPALMLFAVGVGGLLAFVELLWLRRPFAFAGSWWALALLAVINAMFILLLAAGQNSYLFLFIFPIPIIPVAYVVSKGLAYFAIQRITGVPVHAPWKLAFLSLFFHAAVASAAYSGFTRINPTRSNLEQAIRENKNGLLDLMLWISVRSEPNMTILVNEAIVDQNGDALRRLIRRGADPRQHYRLREGTRETQWLMTRWMLSRGLKPVDFDALDQSPPFVDIAVGHSLADLEYCLQKGFEPQKYPGVISAALSEPDEAPALKDKILLLLNDGADINGRDLMNFTPILNLLRLSVDLSPVLELLIEKGADINVQSPHPMYPPGSAALPAGLTPLMLSVIDKNPEYVAILIKSGADRAIRDSRGFSALDYARKQHADDATIGLLQ